MQDLFLKKQEFHKDRIVIGIDEVGRGSLIDGVFVSGYVNINDDEIFKRIKKDSKKTTKSEREEIFIEALKSTKSLHAISVATKEEVEKYNVFNATMRAMGRVISAMLYGINPELQENEKTKGRFVSGFVHFYGLKSGILCIDENFSVFKEIKKSENINKESFLYSFSDTKELINLEEHIINRKDFDLFLRKKEESINAINTSLKKKKILIIVDGNKKPQGWWERYVTTICITKGDEKHKEVSFASIMAKVARDNFIKNKLHKMHPQYSWDENYGYGTKKHIDAIKKYGPTSIHRRTFLKKIID